jgi:hypothetical protein
MPLALHGSNVEVLFDPIVCLYTSLYCILTDMIAHPYVGLQPAPVWRGSGIVESSPLR